MVRLRRVLENLPVQNHLVGSGRILLKRVLRLHKLRCVARRRVRPRLPGHELFWVQRADSKDTLMLLVRAGARLLAEEIRACLRLHLTIGIFKSGRQLIVGLRGDVAHRAE